MLNLKMLYIWSNPIACTSLVLLMHVLWVVDSKLFVWRFVSEINMIVFTTDHWLLISISNKLNIHFRSKDHMTYREKLTSRNYNHNRLSQVRGRFPVKVLCPICICNVNVSDYLSFYDEISMKGNGKPNSTKCKQYFSIENNKKILLYTLFLKCMDKWSQKRYSLWGCCFSFTQNHDIVQYVHMNCL